MSENVLITPSKNYKVQKTNAMKELSILYNRNIDKLEIEQYMREFGIGRGRGLSYNDLIKHHKELLKNV